MKAFPIITVPDLPACVQFYERLGFVPTYQFPPEGEPGFVSLERGECSLGIAAGDAGFAYWIYVDDVDGTLASLAAAGATVVDEPTDQPWGERIARVRDPAGNEVILGQEI